MPSLSELVEDEVDQPVNPRIAPIAEAIVSKHGAAARALLFYGSCLRECQLDGLMLDFYLIVSSYDEAYASGLHAFLNRHLPPNVYPMEAGGMTAKYAVLSEADFARMCSLEARDVSVWARFAQPSRLIWTTDVAARAKVISAISQAAPTLFERTLPTIEGDEAILDVWNAGFALTYAAELRAERGGRGGSIIDADPARYEAFGRAALAQIAERRGVDAAGNVPHFFSPKKAQRWWRFTQRRGKLLTLARLAKASITYAGGIDYLAWKINRHAGTKLVIQPWQRRWPLLGALTMLPRLILRGAVR